MLKKRTVLGDGDRFDQMRRDVVEGDGLTPSVAFGGDRTEYSRLKLYFVKLRIRIAVADRGNRFAVFREFDGQRRKNLRPVDRSRQSGLDTQNVILEHIPASRGVGLIISFDVASRF